MTSIVYINPPNQELYEYAKRGNFDDVLQYSNMIISVNRLILLLTNKIKNVKISEIVDGNVYFIGINDHQLFIRNVFIHYNETKTKSEVKEEGFGFNLHFYINKDNITKEIVITDVNNKLINYEDQGEYIRINKRNINTLKVVNEDVKNNNYIKIGNTEYRFYTYV
jgi:hypothetical protein